MNMFDRESLQVVPETYYSVAFDDGTFCDNHDPEEVKYDKEGQLTINTEVQFTVGYIMALQILAWTYACGLVGDQYKEKNFMFRFVWCGREAGALDFSKGPTHYCGTG